MQKGARCLSRHVAGVTSILSKPLWSRTRFFRGAVGLSAASCLVVAHASVSPSRASSSACAAAGNRKKAIVFGGTSGIGLATCIRLRDSGADVLALSRSGVPQIEGSQNVTGIRFAKCDVTNLDDVTKVLKEAGQVDILISAATGGERALGPFLEMDMKAYQGSFAKLWGYANVVRIGGHHVAEGGAIVLVSGAPARRPRPGQVALACVGASVEQLVRTVAPELAAKKVRINVVSPGIISTPMFGQASGRDDRLTEATKANLIPRPGTADEVAGAIMFAVENTFVTGTTIDVDGGWLHRP